MTQRSTLLGVAGILLALVAFLFHESETTAYTERMVVDNEQIYFSPDYFRSGPSGSFDPGLRQDALNKIKHRSGRSSSLGLEYKFRGPDNVGGRTRAMIELIGQPETLLAGSTTGGLFTSFNGGATWQPHNQFKNLENSTSVISSMAQDPESGNIYIGTGSSFDAGGTAAISMPGNGIYISADQGRTFTHLSETAPENRDGIGAVWTAVNRISIGASGNIYAATNAGCWFSQDEGDTWEPTIYIDPGKTLPVTAPCGDVVTTTDGRVVIAFTNGNIYRAEEGSDMNYELITKGLETESVIRAVCAVSPSNPDIMYAALTNSDECLRGVYKTQNGGDSWQLLLEPADDFNPYANAIQCQGFYDAAIAVSPTDPNTIFLGGVQIWRYDGNLTRIASENGGAPFLDILPRYVHADKHAIYYSPNDPKRMYVCSDGGVTMTMDRGDTWQGINKLYGTTQFYGIGFSSDGEVLGGTQDNGTLALLQTSDLDPNAAVEVNGGDGMDCDVSQYSQVFFASNPGGAVVRGEADFPIASLPAAGGGPFWTVVRLWETLNDPNSRDSIAFINDSIESVIGTSNGAVKSYQKTIQLPQASSRIIENSIRVFSGTQTFHNRTESSVLTGDGFGAIEFSDNGEFSVNVTFQNTPSANANIVVRYAVRYNANDELEIRSENLKTNLSERIFTHRLENNLEPGDQVIVQDPVQSMLGVSSANGLSILRGVLNTGQNPEPIEVPNFTGSVRCIEFTPDGDVAYVGVGTRLIRLSGLSGVYSESDVDQLSNETLYSTSLSQISGISIDPSDASRIVATVGGYGSTEGVVEITNALGSEPVVRNIHGDLPSMPVYDAEIDRSNPDIILLGTEFGIWSTQNASSSSVNWTDENHELTYVPVFDIRQQKLAYGQASNSGVYYIGTYGRGIWETGTLTGVGEAQDWAVSEDVISSLAVFPNPVQDVFTVSFESQQPGTVTLNMFDMQGRIVKSQSVQAAAGKNLQPMTTNAIRPGVYFIQASSGEQNASTRFIVL